VVIKSVVIIVAMRGTSTADIDPVTQQVCAAGTVSVIPKVEHLGSTNDKLSGLSRQKFRCDANNSDNHGSLSC